MDNRYLNLEVAAELTPEAEALLKKLAEPKPKYWVIKNPDTGLYFRGKGANRWGKYLNQASIFRIRGQVESSCDWINKCHRNGERAVIVEIKISEVQKNE